MALCAAGPSAPRSDSGRASVSAPVSCPGYLHSPSPRQQEAFRQAPSEVQASDGLRRSAGLPRVPALAPT